VVHILYRLRRSNHLLATSLILWIGGFSGGQLVRATEFRVDTDIYLGAEDRPLASMTSWCTEKRIYDQSDGEDGCITIFDLERREVTLLSPKEKQRTRLSFDQILRFVAATTTRTTELAPVVRFAAAPKFAPQWDEKTQRIALKHELMSYSAKLAVPPDAASAEQYRTFTDWAARLNTLCPGLPPAARLQLNQAIADRQAVPLSVRRTTAAAGGLATDMVSRHAYRWQLSAADTARLAVFDSWANSLQFVDYESFRRSQGAADQRGQ